ncbi:MAG: cupin domain-containing protein [Comamonadaceae bacterium]|nr:MAG: cupin domain-containing protein [Comamonadaceae bacterium]
MSVISLKDIQPEFVTPKHSTAFGRLITGDAIEVGVFSYEAGKGASIHAHPHEQIFIVLKGRMVMTIDGQDYELGPGEAAHMKPDVSHGVRAIEDSDVVSAKSIVGGVGHRI